MTSIDITESFKSVLQIEMANKAAFAVFCAKCYQDSRKREMLCRGIENWS